MKLTVMSFNVRYDNPKDGENAWPHRRAVVAKLLRERAPDLVGTQEGLAAQLDELEESLPGYRAFGMGRRGPGQDEHCRVFYRSDTLKLRRAGDFWLSETPEQIGSRTEAWGNTLPRMVTWGEFEPVEEGAPFTFVNTHLDHASAVARERSAEQIVRFLRRPEVVHPAIVAGDTNVRPGSRPMQLLLGEAPVDGTASLLRDAFRLSGGAGEGKPTFHGFSGRGRGRIDYVLVEAPFRVVGYEVLDQPVNGKWPSDHFPVLARVER